MMAIISISTEYESTFSARLFNDKLLTVDYKTDIASGYENPDGTEAHHAFDAGQVQIHGTLADLRALAAAIYDATEEVEIAALEGENDAVESL